MYSKLLTILLYVAIAATCAAAPVTPDEAAATATRFLTSRGHAHGATRLKGAKIRQASPVKAEVQPAYYIFNAEGGGYVIVAADDRARSILAYSDRGGIDPDNLPVGCAAWLKSYEDEIVSLKDIPDGRDSRDTRGVTYPSVKVGPMVPVRWGQGSPYNDMCPVDNTTGRRAIVGCGATAMAQIMGYHRYPERPQGSVSYRDAKQEIDRTLDFDAEPAFDWDAILDTDAPSHGDAVARLMKCAAYGAEMDFSSQTSISYLRTCSEALYRYFGYDRGICRYERAIMDDQAWIDMLVGELTAGRPVIYEGRASAGQEGHIFICDGYDGEGLFHINWGWEGKSDGYYSLSALTPSSQGLGGTSSDYTRMQVVTANIAPEGEASPIDVQPAALYMDRLYIATGQSFESADDGTRVVASASDTPGFFFYCWNVGYNDYSGEICAAKVVDGTIVPLAIVDANIATGAYSRDTRLSIDLTAIPEGGCEVSFYCRNTSGSQWTRVCARNGQSSSCHVMVDGDDVTFTPVMPVTMMALSKPFEAGEVYAGRAKAWTLSVSNVGDSRFEGYAGIMACNLSTGKVTTYTEPIFCVGGESADVTVTFPADAFVVGEYSLTPFVSVKNNPAVEEVTPLSDVENVTVFASPSVVIMPVGFAVVYTLDKRRPTIEASLTNMSPSVWSGIISGFIFRSNQSGEGPLGKVSAAVSLSSGSNAVGFDASDIDIPVGEGYRIEWCLGSGHEFPMTSGTLVVSDSGSGVVNAVCNGMSVEDNGGVLTVTSPGTVSAVLVDMSGRTVSHAFGEGKVSVSKAGLAVGVYVLHVKSGIESFTTKIIIK